MSEYNIVPALVVLTSIFAALWILYNVGGISVDAQTTGVVIGGTILLGLKLGQQDQKGSRA